MIIVVFGLGRALEKWEGNLVTIDSQATKLGPIQAAASSAETTANNAALEVTRMRNESVMREVVRYQAADPATAIASYESDIAKGVLPQLALQRALSGAKKP